MTRFRRLVDDDSAGGGAPVAGSASFGTIHSLFDIERGLLRMQSADPASIQKALKADSILSSFGSPEFQDEDLGNAAALAGLIKLQAATNHPPSPQAAAGELARLYDLFAQSAQPAALLVGRKQMLEAMLLPAFLNKAQLPSNIISTICQALTIYWLGVPVTGGGVVTGFFGAVPLAAELNSIFYGGANTSKQIVRRLARCFIIATTKVQYTLPGPVIGFMQVYPPITV